MKNITRGQSTFLLSTDYIISEISDPNSFKHPDEVVTLKEDEDEKSRNENMRLGT